MYKGILDGQASAGRFLELLAGSKDEAVQAALCHSKVVRMLCRTLEGAPTPRARGAALAALQAFCRQDSANLRKLVWSGSVGALLGVLQAADAPAVQQAAALQLLSAEQLPRHPETWQEMRDMMAEMMGGSEEAQAQRLECQKQMDEASGELRLRMATPAGCRAGRVAVWCEQCMARGKEVTQLLSSRTVGVPGGKPADGTALVVVLKGAVLEE